MIVGVVCALASGCGLVAAFGDLYGENPVSWSMVLDPLVVSAFPTVELTWRPEKASAMGEDSGAGTVLLAVQQDSAPK